MLINNHSKLIPIILLAFTFSACASISLSPNSLQIPQITSPTDKDSDGIDDYLDIVQAARAQIGIVTEYDTSYYAEAYPPENSGACADVIWRALQQAGYDLKALIDQDIAQNPTLYPQNPIQDPNINFRRVNNVKIFLERHAQSLTTEVIPWDEKNLEQWQGGDIVTYAQIPGGLWHIAIISDKRAKDGIPYLLHNYGQGVQEKDHLLTWPTEITGHFRFDLSL
jgi:hypothetical protein